MAPKRPPPKRRRTNASDDEAPPPLPSTSPVKETEKEKEKGNSKEKGDKAPLVVFAHGAGAPSTSDWMVRWKEMIGEALEAVEVVTFDYPYISGAKRKAPPKAEKLVDHHLSVVRDALAKHPGHPLVLMGKSMGSRVSCMVVGSDEIDVAAVVCLGYPLKGMNGAVRDETLIQLKVPTMFVQGSKDGLCPLDKLASIRKKMDCKNELHVIDGGDHSFKIGKKFLESSGKTQDQAEQAAVKAIADFISKSIEEN
ncbi:KAT8 regulatory NSL complex subunit 3 [Rhynchospora pubera]|uniref:KAT8 regulatory NSL complex subunit 3 n=1 Tax=Rhynchospora pubera TaxID=906938 RepID=A0AAV8FU36_9POAL|nr:KAT8 regulatory NSL complex subunit 3 [Rhynchospora pubera]